MDLTMLEDVLSSLYNWFDVGRERGEFEIADGSVCGVELIDGQYFRVVGSVLNDGLHQWPATDLKDETFVGEVWSLAVPEPVVRLSTEMGEWVAKHPVGSGYTSESFGGYSYSLPTNPQTGQAASVYDVFRDRLNRYRKLPLC